MTISAYSDSLSIINQILQSRGLASASNNPTVRQQSLAHSANLANAVAALSSVHQTTNPTVNGQNSGQLASVNVISPGTASPNLQGSVLQPATQATLTVSGRANGTVSGGGTYLLSGNQGSSLVTLTDGQSLLDAANSINTLASQTGVFAAVKGENLVLTSVTAGSQSSVTLRRQQGTSLVSGLNSPQIGTFQVLNQAAGTTETLSGTVSSTATAAGLVYHGDANGRVAGSATFTLTGSAGSTQVSLSQGDSLVNVASRINQQNNLTGVVATVKGNELQLTSSTTGAVSTVQVSNITPSQRTSTTGINNAQLSGVAINSIGPDSRHLLTGTIQSASQAQLTLQGSTADTIIDTATFQLTGSQGSTTISVEQGQALSDVASQINRSSNATGVTAVISNHQLVLQSTGVGSSATVGIQLTNISHTTVVTGANAQQLSSFQTDSLTTGGSDVLSGQVTQTATQAKLTLQGSSTDTVLDSASFQLSGALGSTSVSITKGQTLSSVAAQINAASNTTGVVASVASHQLVLQSAAVGSAANVGLQLTNIAYNTTVTGVNSQQLTSFVTTSFTDDATDTLSGSITQAAGQAQLTFNGSLGFVGRNSTFTLQGSNGSAQFTTSTFESLSTLTSQINAATANTGVSAALNGNTLTLTSTGVGSSALAKVTVTSGSFSVSGGNGSGTAYGTNAVARINGTTVTGSGNDFQYSDTKGTFSFSAKSGYTGTISPITISSQAGQFTVSGGNENGTANGTDAVAIINGHTVTGTGNSFQYADSVGSYSFSTVAGYAGAISPVSITSQAGQFSVSGGNGSGSAQGTDASATINGQSITGTGNTLHYTESGVDVTLQVVSGYQGTLSPIALQSQAAAFYLDGGDGQGTSHGTNLDVTINGNQYTSSNNTIAAQGDHGTYLLGFNPGSTGQFSSITATRQTALTISGGDATGTAHGTDAVAVIDGTLRFGVGDTVAYDNGQAAVLLQFQPGFQGQFDAVSIVNSDLPANSTSSIPTNTDRDVAAQLQLLQQRVNQRLILSQFGQLENQLNQLQSLANEFSSSVSQYAVRSAPSASSVSATSGSQPLNSSEPSSPPSNVTDSNAPFSLLA